MISCHFTILYQASAHYIAYRSALLITFFNCSIYIFIGKMILYFAYKFTRIHFTLCFNDSKCALYNKTQEREKRGQKNRYDKPTLKHEAKGVFGFFFTGVHKVAFASKYEFQGNNPYDYESHYDYQVCYKIVCVLWLTSAYLWS